MLTQNIRKQVLGLPIEDRLALIKDLIDSVRAASPSRSLEDIAAAVQRLDGLLVTDEPAPTDEEVKAMLHERRMEKYG